MIFQFKEELKTVPVHFAGSIAFFSNEEIQEVATEMGYKVKSDDIVKFNDSTLKNQKLQYILLNKPNLVFDSLILLIFQFHQLFQIVLGLVKMQLMLIYQLKSDFDTEK